MAAIEPAGQRFPGQGDPGQRSPGLDLLRAAAILLVLIAHFGDRALWGSLGYTPLVLNLSGHLGVELFFVLSGYLIGNLLLDLTVDRRPTPRDWAVFMARRLMRTVPAYLMWVLILLATRSLGATAPYFWTFPTFTQNLAWPMPPGNWFAVSWSLTVEEWFYLLFSITTLSLAAALPRFGVSLSIAAFLTVPLALRVLVPFEGSWDETVRKVVIFRLDAIAYGVLLAQLMRSSNFLQRNWRAALVIGLVVVGGVCAWWQLGNGQWEPRDRWFGLAVLSVTSIGLALLIPAALRLRLAPGRIAAAIAWTSTLSYGMYLCHVPMLGVTRALYKHGLPLSLLGVALATAATIAVSWLSWRYVEKPILDRRPAQRATARAAEAPPERAGAAQSRGLSQPG